MKQKRGFTLVELLVVIGIIAVLISLLLPALSKARQSANAVACASNMRQAGIALRFYQDDNKGFLPLVVTEQPAGSGNFLVWQHLLKPYIGGERPYERIHCPLIELEFNGSSTITFGLNVVLVEFNYALYKKTDKLRDPVEIILIADRILPDPAGYPNPWSGGGELMPREGFPYDVLKTGVADYRHNKKANVCFLDLHVDRSLVPPNDGQTQNNQHPWKGKY